MDTLFGPVVLLGAGVAGFLAIDRQKARLQRAEAKIDWLYQLQAGLNQRIGALEARAPAGPPLAAPLPAPPPAPAPPEATPVAWPVVAYAPSPSPEPQPAPSPSPSPSPEPQPAPPRAPDPPPAPLRVPDPPPAPAPALEPEPASPLAAPSVDWERWVGVRGAAALGAGILVIALLYFLRYSMNEGWLTPGRRVVLGGALSACAVAFAQLRLRRTHAALAGWVTGAGVAGSYASVWAAQYVGGLLGAPAAFGLVVALTAGCVALAVGAGSLPIALLGMAGGFAAPLSLAVDGGRPFGIMAYLAVLDLASVALALRKRWWSLAALSLAASALYEAAWLSAATAPLDLPTHLGVLVVCAGVFAALPAVAAGDGAGGEEPPPPLARLTRYAGVVVPYACSWKLAAGFAAVAPLPLGGLLVVLTALSVVIARARREWALPAVAAACNAVASLAWASNADVASHVTALLALALALFAPMAALARLETARPRDDAKTAGRMVASATGGGALALVTASALVFVAAFDAPDAYLLHDAGWLGLSALGVLLAHVARAPAVATGALAALALALNLGATFHRGENGPAPSIAAFVAGGLAIVAALGLARARPSAPAAPGLASGSRWASLVFLAALALHARALPTALSAAVAAALALVWLLSPGLMPVGYTALGASLAVNAAAEAWGAPRPSWAELLLCEGAVALLYLATPFVARRGLLNGPSLPHGHALAIVAFGPILASPFLPEADGAASIALAGMGVAFALSFFATRAAAPPEAAGRGSRQVVGALAVAATSAAIVTGLDKELMAYGLSALGLVLIGLRRPLGADVLRVVGVVHLGAAALRVVANPSLLAYHPRGDLPVLNWLTPAFLAPAAACLLGSRLARRGDDKLHLVPGALSLILLFGWANVAALDVFSSGATVSFETTMPQARDLTISLIWAAFGVGLLALGMRRDAGALRWTSLVLTLATAGKVFLYDLSQLEDLYRVASLVALAATLIGISVLYQRFVFGPARQAPAAAPPGGGGA